MRSACSNNWLSSTLLIGALGIVAGSGLGCEDPPSDAEKESPKASDTEAQALKSAPAVVAPTPTEASEPSPAPAVEKKPIVCPPAPRVQFSDASLEAEVRRKAQKPEGALTIADLRKVRSVDLTRGGGKVESLDPCIFPLLTSVRHLYLGGGNVTDLSPIKGLTKLEGLRISMNPVADISPLAGMVQMDRLDLGRTQIRDLTPLKGMTKMTELMLDDTPVEDVSPLAGLTKLERLSIKRTRVTDVSPLRSLTKLKFLYVGGSPVENPGAAARPGLKISDED
jgi:internalin A